MPERAESARRTPPRRWRKPSILVLVWQAAGCGLHELTETPILDRD